MPTYKPTVKNVPCICCFILLPVNKCPNVEDVTKQMLQAASTQ